MLIRSRWAAIGAAVAVSLGAGGLSMVAATDEAKPVTVAVEPERVLDTRVDLGLTGPFVNETPRELKVTGSVSVASGGSKVVVPAGALAVLVNVTVVNPTGWGFLSLRPGGAAGVPSTSTVNFVTAGLVEPNAATVALDESGKVQIYLMTASATGSADVLLDIVGYTVDHDHDDRYYTEAEIDSELAAMKSKLAAVELDVEQIESDLGARVTALELAQPFAVTARAASVDLGVTGVSRNPYVVVSLQVSPPVAGHLTVNSTLAVEIDDPISGAAPPWTSLQCSITTGTTLDADYLQDLNREKTDIDKDQLSGTRVLAVAGETPVDVNLVCQHDTLFTRAAISDATLTAVFTPAP